MASAIEYELQVKNLLTRSNDKFKKERPPDSHNKSGLGFLRRTWTVVEILTTSVMFFEMFGWVSALLFHIAGASLYPCFFLGVKKYRLRINKVRRSELCFDFFLKY